MDSATAPTSANLDRVKMVVYTRSRAQPPVMAALIQQLESQKARLEYEVTKQADETILSIKKTNMTVLILTLHEKEELVEVLNVLTAVQDRIQTGLLRAMVLNGMNHPRVLALLKSKGVVEIIDFNSNIKALNHKIKNSFLVVTQAFQRLHNQKLRASTVLGSDAKAAARQNRNDSTNEVQWDKPVEHASDIWWIPSAKNLRNVMGRWLLDILGPGPAAGFWEETSYDRNGERGWEWKPRVATDTTFQPVPGRWLFFGRQPEFIWQKNLWAFVAKMPYLAFYAAGEKDPTLVRVDSPATGKLKVHENSEVSRAYLPKIQASLEASLKLSKGDGGEEVKGDFSPGGMGMEPAFQNKGSFSVGDLSPDAPAGEWNNHEESVGFGFKATDLRVAMDKAKHKRRNALSADETIGGKIGMAEIRQSGLATGTKSFDQMVIDVRIRQRNGVPFADPSVLRVIELTAARASFEFPHTGAVNQDRFLFQVEFRLGDVEKKFDLEWAVEAIQQIDGAQGVLALGAFVGGGLDELHEILRFAEQRQLELKDFFLVAKGA